MADQFLIDPKTKLNFEQRVLRPSAYPSIDNKDGTFSTHRMAWGGGDDGYYAYPTIIQGEDGQLVQLDDDAAWFHAMGKGEYRRFNTPEEASSYADGGYKKSWGLGEKK